MRRVAAVLLALVLVATIVPSGSLASANATVSLDKAVYKPNESMAVSTAGVTDQMKTDLAFIAIYKVGAPHNQHAGAGLLYPPVGSHQTTFRAPAIPGAYEVRLYDRDRVFTDETLIMSVPFTVSAFQWEGTITLDQDTHEAGGKVRVTVTKITADMVTAKALVSIHRRGAKYDPHGTFEHVPLGDSTVELTAPNLNGDFEVRLYSTLHDTDSYMMAVPFTLTGAIEQPTSSWAVPEIARAYELGLIPESLRTADLTAPITRAEFAAVSVRLYENLSGETLVPAATNPFVDTTDADVLKALDAGITAGVAIDRFAPSDLLNREQAATMLTRVFKMAYVEGWTLDTDADFNLQYTAPAPFADDAHISTWAKPSVYFMVAHGVIAGVGSNTFQPRAVTSAQQASNYAVATREAAIAIAVRVADKLDPAKAVVER